MSAKGRGAVVREHEFYATPVSAIEAILRELDGARAKQMKWGEPCAGDGAIINAMWRIHKVEPSKWEWAEIREGKDYLKGGLTGEVDGNMSNPPFSLAVDFINQSLSEAGFVAYLLRLNFWGSKKRKEWWQEMQEATPVTHQFTLSERPSFTGKGTDATEYAWFVWDGIGLCNRKPGMYVI
jgi:hypothetical protein